MSKAAVDQQDVPTWKATAPGVIKALRFIKRKGAITADELVAWDFKNGQRLFDWNDTSAAAEWRTQQARVFLNHFRGMFEGMRVRAFIHVHEDEEVGIEASGYRSVATIAADVSMRRQVVDDLVRRMQMLASELKMWKLTPEERDRILGLLAEKMGSVKDEAA